MKPGHSLLSTIAELTGLRGSGCAGKIEYLTLSGARHALARLRATSRTPEGLCVYRCKKCVGIVYHIGHSSRSSEFFADVRHDTDASK